MVVRLSVPRPSPLFSVGRTLTLPRRDTSGRSCSPLYSSAEQNHRSLWSAPQLAACCGLPRFGVRLSARDLFIPLPPHRLSANPHSLLHAGISRRRSGLRVRATKKPLRRESPQVRPNAIIGFTNGAFRMQSRRIFISQVATGLAGTLASSGVLGANDRIRIGIIGAGARGSEILRQAHRVRQRGMRGRGRRLHTPPGGSERDRAGRQDLSRLPPRCWKTRRSTRC